jgi:D-xylose transport system ATP-binding protein
VLADKGSGQGIPVPVLIWAVVVMCLAFIANRTRFGRYVYAIGGNPEAARLVGIPVKKVTLKLFLLLAVMVAVASIVQVSRLNAGTNSLGTSMELYVIAAAVLGARRTDRAIPRERLAAAGREHRLPDGHHRPGADRGRGIRRSLSPCHRGAPDVSGHETSSPLIQMRSIRKAFGGVRAVADVSLAIYPGEVVALLGHNGAGKSTLMKLLAGAYPIDSGEIRVAGKVATIESPADAQRLGIESIYQTLALADNLDSVANLFLGRELTTRWGTLDEYAMEKAARDVFKRLNPNFRNIRVPVRSLSGGQRQVVAISRALHFNARALIMDEPCAALGPEETRMVHDLVRKLKAGGVGIFLISHDMPDVFGLSDRLSVMKNGKTVGTYRTADVTEDEVLGMIIAGKRVTRVAECFAPSGNTA